MAQDELRRELGVFGAMMMGLGSIVGTGVFVSIGVATETAGPSVIYAIVLAAIVATCNGLSSAQLAANHPVSGGTYEYGYRWLTPWLGFTSGWLFLCAKSASAGTAALGFAGYLGILGGFNSHLGLPVIAFMGTMILTIVTLLGIRRTNVVNTLIVCVTLATLLFFIVAGLPGAMSGASDRLVRGLTAPPESRNLLHATALMFVAYTGYGRIATLGEEVREPRRTIPRAVIATLLLSMFLYVGVAVVGIATVGAAGYAELTRQHHAPLQSIASNFGVPGGSLILGVGAITSMLGVLLNLLLGLSRVLFAMGRRGDMPQIVARVNASTGVPWVATLVIAGVITLFIVIGDIHFAWSFSALTVLIYYAATNLCAIQLAPSERLFPIWPAYVGLSGCLFLACWIDAATWGLGVAVLAVGWICRAVVHRAKKSS